MWVEFICFVLFIPLFFKIIYDYVKKNKESIKLNYYARNLNETLISQTHNHLFYEGNVNEGAKLLTKEVTNSVCADRCSIWLYNQKKTSIVCEQLYEKKTGEWVNGIEIFEKDYKPYFNGLKTNPIIIANDVNLHPSTQCFKETYSDPLGVRAMLDVPIVYKGEVIGVICIESYTVREWHKVEVNFAEMLSSLFSFAYSVQEGNELKNELGEFEHFVDSSVLVSKTDKRGKIVYVNKKFEDVSGWSLDECLGKDHNIVNSGIHDKKFWANMYKTVKKGGIWNDLVINKNKEGELYWVDTYIKADFDSDSGKVKGYTSIRQDVTELKKKEVEIHNRMNAINKSNAVIEFDLEGNIVFANNLFLETMGYSSNAEVIGNHHRIFVDEEYSKSDEYRIFWEKLKDGLSFSGEIIRIKKDGSLVYLQATYNPILSVDGKVYRVMKISTDITTSYEQKREIEKKNTYLEHAAKILRHDMHSGINTYIPRGISSLERRLKPEDIETLKLEAPLKMLKEGLKHTQKVYKGVYEFTNLVKQDVVLTKENLNLRDILNSYLTSTAYSSQVAIDWLPTLDVNEPLFCTAIDNLIRNGLKYNDSDNKVVAVYMEDENHLALQDNGRGMTQSEFEYLSQPYHRKEGQKESGTGLGLNICIAILHEHGFTITCEKNETGTKMKIKLR
jgi:PAS domain S-box-containing protein